ncbi:MAG: hypothetical protein E7291_03730 [Lachnospiraceae bacterium]|nr:hypothetical protein [Lachnospiraceae bacterium]
MKTYLKEKVLKHIKWFILVLILCFVYAFISLSGWKGIGTLFKGDELVEIPMEQGDNNIEASISQTENLIIEISELPQKQETVKLSFYNKDNEVVKEKDYILRVGYNNIGELNEEVTRMQYESEHDIFINHLYLAQGNYINWPNLWYIVLGLFVLCTIQRIITLVRKKYAN